jgi:tRNA pseudouridine55 synthase
MDGLIVLDKPVGLTSAKALYRVRKATGQRKSGHAGALDPLASGVLLLCMGQATKLVEALMDQPKVYRATARLDLTSLGFDAEGEATPVNVPHPPDGAAVERRPSARGESERPSADMDRDGGVPARGGRDIPRPRRR